ncbi:hypothetical protein [Scytonema sp. NUACC26]|uniref:hypothetical protein n=1 Tax=Scytonema sp. NUACC26 TaxID=3140176 RepID=UPI0034DBE789
MSYRITKLDSDRIEIEFDGHTLELTTHQLLGAIAATVGAEDYLENLKIAHGNLAYQLYLQNCPGENASEPYEWNSNSGEKLEKLLTKINEKLFEIDVEK